IGPMRPATMSTINRHCAHAGNTEVRPVDSPTTPNAETTSNNTGSSGWSVVVNNSRVVTATSIVDRNTRLSDWRITSGDNRRPNTCTLSCARTSVTTTATITARVVTLMPPDVPALPPPTNMSMMVTSSLVSSILPYLITLTPPMCG